MSTYEIRAQENYKSWSEWTEQTSCDGRRELLVRSRRCNSTSTEDKSCHCERGDPNNRAENSECQSPIPKARKPVCSNGYIHWNPPVIGRFVNDSLLSVKILQNITSCQQFCYTTPRCVAAALRQNGECLLMGSSSPVHNHKEMTLLTYSCCPHVNGSWSSWSEYSKCDSQTGLMIRTRECNSPPPSGGGANCQGNLVEAKECQINGAWSSWSEYSPCNNQTGSQIRTRHCNNPRPSVGGAPCDGSSVETIMCGGGSFKALAGRSLRLRQHFISRKKTVSSRDECIKICLNKVLNPMCEVFQIEYESASPNKFRCRTSTVRAIYLAIFTKRYLEEDPDYNADDEWTTFHEIYYLNVASDIKEHQLPELFYPLDEISKNLNLGKLDSNKHALSMGSSPQHFECDFAFGQSKFLTLIPSDAYRISIPEVTSIPFNATSNLTISLWIKKRLPEIASAPILEGTSKGNTIGEWLLWNFDQPHKFYPLFGRGKAITSPSFNVRAWNYVVMRIDGPMMELYVNNQLEGSISLAGTVRSIGDYISIGRRVGNPSGWGANNNLFDGCMGHLMLFTRSIQPKEIIQFGRLTLDGAF